ncbi:MAG: hypothetical protein KatS3mg131_3538 [Candidatus Tectimicrobiota bacterium]|nr:MAG: hypothetical protein KatS3mg131_3538 [Candidatus Tectomicrobia bacterium]
MEASVQFHVLSFEGPDPYSYAGGLASRVTGLTEALAAAGFETHLWFIGDPALPGHERRGRLVLHRWCQWISRYHAAGVYDGEEGKRADYTASLPPFLWREVLAAHLQRGGRAVVLAEEWHTVEAVLHLDALLHEQGCRPQVAVLWNANNTFGFERIDWRRLAAAATITTVSRYMKHLMRPLGVDPLVIPNGLASAALRLPRREAVLAFRSQVGNRVVLSKVARWDPEKHWLLAVAIVAELKRQGWRPLLVARGGVEPYGAEVLAAARDAGLRVVERSATHPGVGGLLQLVAETEDVDVLSVRSHLDPDSRRVLFQGSDAVLANSRHEPFGLVGLETMAVGGVACTGCTGEDYAQPGRNALVLETADPVEFLELFAALRANPRQEQALRRAGRRTALQYAWPTLLRGVLLPRLRLLAPHPERAAA